MNVEVNEHELLLALRRITGAFDNYSRHLAETLGVTAAQLAILRELSESGPLRPTELARRVHVAPATLSEIVKKLVERDYVTRQASETDRRENLCAITEGGRTLIASGRSRFQDHFKIQVSKLAEWERTTMLASLQRITFMLDAANLNPPRPAELVPDEDGPQDLLG